MSPAPVILSKFGFVSILHDLDAAQTKMISNAREYVASVLDPIPKMRAGITSNRNLSPEGQVGELRAELGRTTKDVTAAFASARRDAERRRDDAAKELTAILWDGLATRPTTLETARRELSDLLRDDPVVERDIVTDTATGLAVLGGGNKTLGFLGEIVRDDDLGDARLLTLAALQGGPVLRKKLGGRKVLDAMLATITERVVASDPKAAVYAAARDEAESVLSVFKQDEQAALTFAAKSYGLDAAALNATKPDPVKAASSRAAS